MSVMCVSDKHIDTIVSAYLKFVINTPAADPTYQTTGNRISRLLIDTNLIAYNIRYNQTDGLNLVSGYVHRNVDVKKEDALQLLKAVQCYYYQVDNYLEKPLNVDSENAKFVETFCKDLTFNLITKLEGYNLAKWCID